MVRSCWFLLLVLAAPIPGWAANPVLHPGAMGAYVKREVQPEQLKGLDLKTLQLLRDEVFARHGRKFTTAWVQKHFERQKWYHPNPRYTPSVLGQMERWNVDTIRYAEKKLRGVKIAVGDMKYYRKTVVRPEWLKGLTPLELRILRAEVEALRGKEFSGEPWLRQHFDNRYWYEPWTERPELTPVEKENIRIITAEEKRIRKVSVLPGEMDQWQTKRVAPQDLRGLSLHELRLLQNEVYARHGQQFGKEWLKEYFDGQPWYHDAVSRGRTPLSPVDESNVAAIIEATRALHESLGSQPLSKEALGDIELEDARTLRNEIYARHGKVFKSRWTQRYFESQDWYQRNPAYSDALLTTTERKNAAVILAYEKQLIASFDRVEA